MHCKQMILILDDATKHSTGDFVSLDIRLLSQGDGSEEAWNWLARKGKQHACTLCLACLRRDLHLISRETWGPLAPWIIGVTYGYVLWDYIVVIVSPWHRTLRNLLCLHVPLAKSKTITPARWNSSKCNLEKLGTLNVRRSPCLNFWVIGLPTIFWVGVWGFEDAFGSFPTWGCYTAPVLTIRILT